MNRDTIPYTIKEIFANGDASYELIIHGEEMDNVEAMSYFKERLGAIQRGNLYEGSFKLEADDGTQICITHPGEFKLAVIDSRGLGDFYSHAFDCQILKFDNEKDLNAYIHGPF